MELRRTLAILLILTTTLSVSCSNPEVDSFLIGDDNCKIPCWNLITPGLTTRTDAITIIEKLQDKENYSFTGSDIFFKYNTKRVRVHLNDANQIVDMIDFELDNTTLGQIVDLFGEPKSLSFQLDSGGCTILVYYPETGAYFMGQCNSNLSGNYWKVSKNTKIIRGFLTKPDLEEERLSVLLFGDMSTRMQNNIVPWRGYGPYSAQP